MVTLTGKEIRDLANFAGFMIVEQNYSDELDTEITVFDCSKNGIKDEDENTRVYYKLYLQSLYHYSKRPKSERSDFGQR